MPTLRLFLDRGHDRATYARLLLLTERSPIAEIVARLFCACFLLVVGCQRPVGTWLGATRLEVWAVPEGATVFPDAAKEPENEVFSAGERRIRLAGAVNEVVAFQVVVRSSQPASITQVALDDLRAGGQVIPADRSAMFRQARVLVTDYPAWFLRLTPYLREPRRYPDVLVPLAAPRGGLPIELRPNEAEAVWVEIRIPPGTPAGRYASRLKVWEQTGAAVLDVVLEVWPFALPLTRHLAVVAGLDAAGLLNHHLEVGGKPYEPGQLSFDDPLYPKATAVLDAAVKLLHDHRCAPVLSDVQPRRQAGPAGSLELDWGDYDRLASALIDGSAFEDRSTAAAWPMPIGDRRPPPEVYGGWGSASYERMLVQYLRQCADHFARHGWLDHHFVWIPVDGTTPAQRYAQFERLGRLIRSADARLKAVCTLPPQAMSAWGEREDGFRDVSALVGIWAPSAGAADPAELARQRAAGRRTWLKPDRPPFAGSLAICAPPDHARSLAWQAYRLGCDGLLLEAANAWPAAGTADASGENCLIWPGRPFGLAGPVPSIRLKRLMRGIQDFEYLWLLERNNRPAIARRIAGDMVPFGGLTSCGDHFLDGRAGSWVSDPGCWSLARRLMAAEIASAMETPDTRPASDEAAEVERFERQIEWARFTDAARRVRIAIEGVRVKDVPNVAGRPATLEATVTVLNATPPAVSGRLALAGAPADWLLRDAGEPIADLGPYHGLRRVLRIEAGGLLPNVEGVLPIRVSCERGGSTPDVGDGRIALLTSQKLLNPLKVDGKLEDWPLGAGNVAGDFVLVGASDVPKQGRPSPDRPSQQTTAFVACDDEFLYVAFFCKDDHLAERQIARDNFVHYDELWPTGDDLVEVVLDPSAGAAGPGDLLHIVVKSNGAVVCERGVPALARVAPCADWPAKVIAAVDDRSHADRWTTEIRIPRAALGKHPEVFGINFGRYLPRLGEYSSWSAARRYLYSPASLGNIRLPKGKP